MIPALVVPGADFPDWWPVVGLLIGVVTVGVLVLQAVRYFRRDHDDRD